MQCEEVRRYLAAHLDEELDLARDTEIVAHLNGCAGCAEAALAHAARRGMIGDKALRYGAPAGLEASIRAALPASKPQQTRIPWLQPRRLWLAFVPPLAAVSLVAVLSYQVGARRTRSQDYVEALTSGHVRALMSGHEIDVVSTDQHTVKPWFAGKLDFTPPVVDLAADGFNLTGGRIDHIAGRTVAVLVYERRKHVIDLYIAPPGTAPAPSSIVHSGFNLVSWSRGENHFSAISDLALDELKEFARLFQSRTPSP